MLEKKFLCGPDEILRDRKVQAPLSGQFYIWHPWLEAWASSFRQMVRVED